MDEESKLTRLGGFLRGKWRLLWRECGMPQIQLPLFPDGSTAITPHLGVLVEGKDVVYLNGHLPVFTHQKDDLRSFRFFTSKMVIAGAVKQSEIAKAFGISAVTVKRYVKRVLRMSEF